MFCLFYFASLRVNAFEFNPADYLKNISEIKYISDNLYNNRFILYESQSNGYLIYDSKFFVSVIRFFIDKEIDFLSDRRVLQLIINSVVFCAFSVIGIVNVFRKPNANQESIAEWN